MHEHLDRRHILIVDRDAASQRTVERMLRAGLPGVRVTCTSDGAQALQELDRESIDLVIADLALPDINGVEWLRQVASRHAALPIVALSASGSPGDETRALANGAYEYFEKPLDPDPFMRSVEELLLTARHRSRIEGLSIAGFVQLLSMERKTCALRVSAPGAQGVLYFNSGALVDARQAELSGAEAALEIFTWQEPIITLEAQARGRAATIRLGVTELLLESARMADERERNLRRSRPIARSDAAPMAAAGGGRGPMLSLVPSVAPPRRPTPRPVPSPPPPPSPASSASTPTTATTPTTPTTASWEQPAAQAAMAHLLAEALKIEGVTEAAIANWELDHPVGGASRPDPLLSGNCRVMRALMSAMSRLGLDSRVQDVLITLDDRSHILWPLPQYEGLFLSLSVERTRGNLALTRHRLQKIVGADVI